MNTITEVDRALAYSEALATAASLVMLVTIAVTAIALGYTLSQMRNHR